MGHDCAGFLEYLSPHGLYCAFARLDAAARIVVVKAGSIIESDQQNLPVSHNDGGDILPDGHETQSPNPHAPLVRNRLLQRAHVHVEAAIVQDEQLAVDVELHDCREREAAAIDELAQVLVRQRAKRLD